MSKNGCALALCAATILACGCALTGCSKGNDEVGKQNTINRRHSEDAEDAGTVSTTNTSGTMNINGNRDK